jgi:hypothetical protein
LLNCLFLVVVCSVLFVFLLCSVFRFILHRKGPIRLCAGPLLLHNFCGPSLNQLELTRRCSKACCWFCTAWDWLCIFQVETCLTICEWFMLSVWAI